MENYSEISRLQEINTELITALKNLLATLPGDQNYRSVCTSARAVLAKAQPKTGE